MKEKQSRIIDFYEERQVAFVAELKSRMVYLKEYFDGRYTPLKAGFEIRLEKDEPYIQLNFTLKGENEWCLNRAVRIDKLGIGESRYTPQIAEKYFDEIRGSFEEDVRKEGIRSINTRKV